MVCVSKHTVIRVLWLYAYYQELKDLEIYQLGAEQSDTTLSCTSPSSRFMCLAAELITHREINQDYIQ